MQPRLLSILIFLVMFIGVARADDFASDDRYAKKIISISVSPQAASLSSAVVLSASRELGGMLILPLKDLAAADLKVKGEQVEVRLASDRFIQVYLIQRAAVAAIQLQDIDIFDINDRNFMQQWLAKLKAQHIESESLNTLICQSFSRVIDFPHIDASTESQPDQTRYTLELGVEPFSPSVDYLSAISEATAQSVDQLKCEGEGFLEYLEDGKKLLLEKTESLKPHHYSNVDKVLSAFLNDYKMVITAYQQMVQDESKKHSSHANTSSRYKIPPRLTLGQLQISYTDHLLIHSECQSDQDIAKTLEYVFKKYLQQTPTRNQRFQQIASAGRCVLTITIEHPTGGLNAEVENGEHLAECLQSYIEQRSPEC